MIILTDAGSKEILRKMDNFLVPKIVINTDASFHPDHKVGAYAFFIQCDHFKIQTSGIFKKGTPKDSNEAELMCIGHALTTLLERDYVPYSQELMICTDSLNSIEEIVKQDTNVGRNVNKLWQQLIKRTRSKRNEMMHVPSHSHDQNPGAWANEWCDTEAKELMRQNIPEENKVI